jgi:hypothetical protein
MRHNAYKNTSAILVQNVLFIMEQTEISICLGIYFTRLLSNSVTIFFTYAQHVRVCTAFFFCSVAVFTSLTFKQIQLSSQGPFSKTKKTGQHSTTVT